MLLVFSPKISPFKIYQILGGNWFFRPLPNALFPSVRLSMICSQVFIYSESTVHAHFTHNYGTQARNFFELVHKKYPQEKPCSLNSVHKYVHKSTHKRKNSVHKYVHKSTHKRKEKRSLNSVHKYVHRETFFELSTQVRTQKYPQEKELGTQMYTKVPTRETFFELGINDSLSVELVWWKELLKELQLSLDEGTSFHLQHLQRAPPTWLNRN